MSFDYAASPSEPPPPGVLYTPIVRPPTPAPSPRPLPEFTHAPPLTDRTPSSSTSSPPPSPSLSPSSSSSSLISHFTSLPAPARIHALRSLVPHLTPPELALLHTLLAPLLKRDFLASLPAELALHVLSFVLEPRDLCRAACVSKRWRALVDDDLGVWRGMCGRWGFGFGGGGSGGGRGGEGAPWAEGKGPKTWRGLYRYFYTTYRNWHTRPHLLRSQRLATHTSEPALATITSSALSRTLLVAGLADARIHVFSAQTGMPLRQLAGHESGVWAVCLVTPGGGMDARHRRTVSAREKAKGGEGVDRGEGAAVEELVGLGQRNRAPAGVDVHDPPRLDHLLPPSLRPALALDAPIRWLDNDHDDDGRRGGNVDECKGRGRRNGTERDWDAADACGASRGWGQPGSLVVSGGSDKTVRVWDAESGICLYVLRGHTSTVRTLRVLHNRPVAVSGARDGAMRVWDIQKGSLLRVLSGHGASVRALETYGDEVVSASYDRTCRLWNIDTGACLQIFRGHVAQIYCVAYDGSRVASGGVDTAVRVWDVRTGACLALLQVHTALVCQLQMTRRLLVSGGADGRVMIYELGEPGSTSNDGAGGGGEKGKGRLGIRVAQRLTAHDSSITALQLVCDERLLVTSGNDGRARLWDLDAPHGGRYVREMSEGGDGVWGVVFRTEGGAVMCRRAGKMVVEVWGFGGEVGD